MKKCIVFLLISLLSTTLFASYVPEKIEGEVVSIFCGELNPHVGDYCIVYIKDYETNRLYGLVSDQGPDGPLCDDITDDNVQTSWPVGAYKQSLSLVLDRGLIDGLKDYDKNAFYLFYDDNLKNLDNSY